jgi:ADP-ribosylglycohydrolase
MHDTPEPLARAKRSLEGLSIGDAFGECFFGPPELVASKLAARALPRSPWRWTDDTAMALSVVEVLAAQGQVDEQALASAFARRFRAQPDRGYGRGAWEILSDLGAGVPWREAAGRAFEGQGSRGNGAAMRAAPIGAFFADDLSSVVREARRSAVVTHAHEDGQAGAVAVAVASALIVQGVAGHDLLAATLEHVPPGPTREGLLRASHLPASMTNLEAATALGSGQQVLSSDTVPFALWCVARDRPFADSMWLTVEGLGDRDTTCAIVGGVIAARAPPPTSWLTAREVLG